jgi:type IV secretory pathway VirB10-like protein
VSAGEEVLTPKARRPGPRVLAAVGAVLCLVVGGIIVSVFRGNGSKQPAPVARENPQRPNEPRFLDRQPASGAGRFTAEIEAKQREQDQRRAQLREMLAARTPPAPGASPLLVSGPGGSAAPAGGMSSGEAVNGPVAVPADVEGAPPPGVYRPVPVRSGRPYLAAASPAESRSQSSLARALEAPILLGAAKDQPEDSGAVGPRGRFPLTPPSPPDLKSLLAQLRSGTGGEAPPPESGGKTGQAVDFGRVVWAPAILLTALSSESPGPAEAWIEADAKDPQGRVVLPQGSRIFGSYDTGLALGQRRLVVRWTSIELPNGATVALEGARSAGRDGAGGLRGRVDARIWGVFGRALALSAIGAAAQLGQPQESASFAAPASNRQIAAAAVANELARAAAEVVRQATDIKPVIRVPAGMQFFVFVPADLELR